MRDKKTITLKDGSTVTYTPWSFPDELDYKPEPPKFGWAYKGKLYENEEPYENQYNELKKLLIKLKTPPNE